MMEHIYSCRVLQWTSIDWSFVDYFAINQDDVDVSYSLSA
jgi:hypothetical protein